MEIKNLTSLVGKLRQMAAEANKDNNVSVITGYTAAYAVYVHENMEAVHPVGQAKFLEQPARTLRNVLAGIVVKILQAGRSMAMALLTAALHLQRESQKLAPIETGALKNSAFTRLE